MLAIVVEKLQSHGILSTDETHLIYNFLLDKFSIFPMGKNHRKLCKGENDFTVILFPSRWKILLYQPIDIQTISDQNSLS